VVTETRCRHLADALGLSALREAGLTGAGVRIAHLDSGVAADHPALRKHVAAFCRFDLSGQPVPGAALDDGNGHGTHTAGILASIAPDAAIHSAQVIEGGNVVWRVLRGIDWAIDRKADIVFLPVGLPGRSPILWAACSALRARGILPVVAVGNAGAGRVHAPGWYPHVLSVGAAGRHGGAAPFSGSDNRGEACLKPDLLAPGVDILSTATHDQTARRSGTSMAAAIVAGAAALVLQASPTRDTRIVEQALLSSCRPVEPDYRHRVRLGHVDAAAAYELIVTRPDRFSAAPVVYAATSTHFDPHLERALRFADGDAYLECVLSSSVEDVSAWLGVHAAPLQGVRRIERLPRLNAAYLLAKRAIIEEIQCTLPGAILVSPNSSYAAAPC
jgi:subtilisin family serine protease